MLLVDDGDCHASRESDQLIRAEIGDHYNVLHCNAAIHHRTVLQNKRAEFERSTRVGFMIAASAIVANAALATINRSDFLALR